MKNYVNEISKVMANYDIEDIIFDEMYQQDEYDSEAKMVFENIVNYMTFTNNICCSIRFITIESVHRRMEQITGPM